MVFWKIVRWSLISFFIVMRCGRSEHVVGILGWVVFFAAISKKHKSSFHDETRPLFSSSSSTVLLRSYCDVDEWLCSVDGRKKFGVVLVVTVTWWARSSVRSPNRIIKTVHYLSRERSLKFQQERLLSTTTYLRHTQVRTCSLSKYEMYYCTRATFIAVIRH